MSRGICECSSPFCAHGKCRNQSTATLIRYYKGGAFSWRVCNECGQDPTTKRLTERLEDAERDAPHPSLKFKRLALIIGLGVALAILAASFLLERSVR